MAAQVADSRVPMPSVDDEDFDEEDTKFPLYDKYGVNWAELPFEVVVGRVQTCFGVMYAHYLMYKDDLKNTVPEHEFTRMVNWFEMMSKEGPDSEEYKNIARKILGQLEDMAANQ